MEEGVEAGVMEVWGGSILGIGREREREIWGGAVDTKGKRSRRGREGTLFAALRHMMEERGERKRGRIWGFRREGRSDFSSPFLSPPPSSSSSSSTLVNPHPFTLLCDHNPA